MPTRHALKKTEAQDQAAEAAEEDSVHVVKVVTAAVIVLVETPEAVAAAEVVSAVVIVAVEAAVVIAEVSVVTQAAAIAIITVIAIKITFNSIPKAV